MKPLTPTPSAENVIRLLERDARSPAPDYADTLRAVRLYCDVELARTGLAAPTGIGGGLAGGVVRELPEAARLAQGVMT